MVHFKTYNVSAPCKEQSDITFAALRTMALSELNNDPDVHGTRIINIIESRGYTERRPRQDNSDTWYTAPWLSLIVYYESGLYQKTIGENFDGDFITPIDTILID